MAEQPINNALSNYDNEVTETDTGKAGFAGNLLSGGLSLSSIKNGAANLTSTMSGKIGTFLSDNITKLNELAKGLLGKIPGFDSVLSKLNGFLSNYLDGATDLLKSLLKDTLKQLENASINFINNIIEDFTKNLLSSLYIPDEVFAQTIKGLYYTGADLAYDNHYIRKSAMSRDWVYTLKFLDKEYKVSYGYDYKRLSEDLATCSSNCCPKNLEYIFGKMIENIEEYKRERDMAKSNVEMYKKTYTNYSSMGEYTSNLNTLNNLNNIISEMENMIVSHTKKLIVNSNTYLAINLLEKFFKGDLAYYIKPKYFGTTDDKFNKKYMFTEADCRIMMPTFVEHETTGADRYYLENVNNTTDSLKEEAENARAKQDYWNAYDDFLDDMYDQNNISNEQQYVDQKVIANTNVLLEKYRESINEKQADRYGVLANAAVKGGSNSVYENRTKYSKQNDLASSVKYRKDITGALGEAGKKALYNDTEYITLNNKHIKEIYIYLTSNFSKDEKMVNEAFYLRCKIPTMTTLTASLDKARGILGSTMVVQSLFDIQNDIDRTAYEYTKKVEDYLFDPKKNIEPSKYSLGALTFQIDPKDGKITFEETTMEDIANSVESKTFGTYGSNTKSVDAMNQVLDSNEALRQEVVSLMRYTNNIPMVSMRDDIIKWLTHFYNFMITKQLNDANITHAFSKLCYYIFGDETISDPSGLMKVFDKSTKDSLVEDIELLIYVYKAQLANTAMILDNISDRSNIENLFYLCMAMFAREISETGFIRSLFLYDKEYLKTYIKSLYYNDLDFLRTINNRTREEYYMFYPYKDKMTTILDNFDRYGIFGYNENLKRIQYTNVITGDWKSFIVSTQGVFFGGSDNTKNNGIKMLNSDKTEVINTNMTEGTWIDMFEYFGQTFFVRDTNELYYWNGKKVVSTGVTDYDKWEVKTITRFSKILLLGKNNNGIRHWNNNKFEVVGNISSGDTYKIQQCNLGYAIYPTGNPGKPVIFSSKTIYKVLEVSNSYTYMGQTKKTLHATGMVPNPNYNQNTQPPQPEKIQQSVTTVMYFYFFGTKSSGFKTFCAENTISNLSEYTDSANTLRNVSGLTIPNSTENDTMYYISSNGEYKVTFTDSYNINLGDVSTVTIPVDEKEISIDSTTKTKTFNSITEFNITPENFLLNDTGDNLKYNKVIETNTIYDFTADSIDGTGFLFEPNETVYWKFSDGKGLYKIDEDKFTPLFVEIDNKRTGWELSYINSKLFARNVDEPVGVRVMNDDDGLFVPVGLDTGYWIMGGSKDNFFALSTRNTNKGIKSCSVKELSIYFGDIPKNNITYGDYSGIAYDKSENKIFFGADRTDLTMNIDLINYDIDEFIYPQNEYTLQRLITELMVERLNTFTEFIIYMIESGKDIFVLASSLIEKLMNITVDYRTLRETIYSLPDSFTSKVNMITNPLTLAQYLIDSSSTYSELLPYVSALEAFMIENASFVDIFGMLADMETFMRNMERESALYTELLTRALAKSEFDIDDLDAIDSILLDFINDAKYSGNMQLYYDRLASYKGDRIKYYGLYDYDKDGNQIDLDRDSKEYKMQYVADSHEFMNSDEDDSY